MGRKLGGCAPFGVAGSPCNTVGWAEAYLHTKWHLNPSSRFATMDMGRSRPRPRPHCTRWGRSSRERGRAVPLFSTHVYCGHGRPSQLLLSSCFECNRFIAVRFCINGVFCKENRSNTLCTSRVRGTCPYTRPVHGHIHRKYTRSTCSWTRAVHMTAYTARRVHGRVQRPTWPVRGCERGPFTAVYTAVLHMHTCTPPLQGRVPAIYTALYTASTQPLTWAVYTGRKGCVHVRVHGRVHGAYTAL